MDASDPLEITILFSTRWNAEIRRGVPRVRLRDGGSAQLASGEEEILPAGDWFFRSLEEI
jgi:hypothetical protein